MNRNVIIAAIAVILAVGAYYLFGRTPAEVPAAADAAAEAVEGAAEGAAEVVEGATEAVEGAAEGAAEAVEGAVEGAAEVVEGAADAATEGAAAATEAVTEGAAAATEAVTEGAAAATDAAAAALDPANFNADSVVALIDGSSLDATMKTTLKTAVEAAKTNPALVADTIAQVKAALGL